MYLPGSLSLRVKIFLLSLFALSATLSSVQASDRCVTENVVLVTLDGVRWQEVFHGIDTEISKQEAFANQTALIASWGMVGRISL